MDKESNQKGKSHVSPTLLTPCRPVGLRRKRSIVKTPSSLAVNLSNSAISPSTPVNTTFLKTQILATRNVSEDAAEPGEKCDRKDVESEDQRNLKRKLLTPSCKSVCRRKKIALSSSSPGSPSLAEKKIDLVKNEENDGVLTDVSKDCDDLKSSLTSHTKNALDESTAKEEITFAEINALKSQIASKEKKLKEHELAALYKKKVRLAISSFIGKLNDEVPFLIVTEILYKILMFYSMTPSK